MPPSKRACTSRPLNAVLAAAPCAAASSHSASSLRRLDEKSDGLGLGAIILIVFGVTCFLVIFGGMILHMYQQHSTGARRRRRSRDFGKLALALLRFARRASRSLSLFPRDMNSSIQTRSS